MRVMFVSRPDFVARTIRWFDGGPFNHVALVYGQEVIQAVSNHGVQLTTMDEAMKTVDGYHTLDIPLSKEADAEVWSRSKVGAGYDFLAVGMLALRDLFGSSPHWDSNGHFFCDELMLSSALTGGLAELARPARFFGVEASRQLLLSTPGTITVGRK